MGPALVRSFATIAVMALACGAGLLHLHVLLHAPEMAAPDAFRGALFVRVVVMANADHLLGAPGFTRFTLALASITGVAAAALAVAIGVRVASPATRRLALALALASWAAAYFFVVSAHPSYQAMFGLDQQRWLRLIADFLGYFAGFLAPLQLLRFFMDYPRRPAAGDWEAHAEALRSRAVAAMASGWRRRVYAKSLHAGRMVRSTHAGVPWMLARAQGGTPVLGCALLALALTAADDSAHAGLQAAGFTIAALALQMPLVLLFECLRFHHHNAIASDREKIDWIYGTVFVGGVVWSAVAPLWWLLLWLGLPAVEARAEIVLPGVLFIAPAITSLQLYILAILLALALSIFYRGSVDPRLAIGRVTLVGATSFALALVFLLVERTVALLAAEWLQLPAESGLLLSAVVAAATFSPVRRQCEQATNRLVLAFLPLESLVGGERQFAAVAICDLSGYTALSAVDERQAMLAATLLQRQALQQCERHRGRVVKSMGDAVLLLFSQPADTVRALEALHIAYPEAAAQCGVSELPVHSGAHYGELTVAADGDVYGQVVNIAARLQSVAQPGEAVLSRHLADSAGLPADAGRPLGALALKNVPEPLEALALGVARA